MIIANNPIQIILLLILTFKIYNDRMRLPAIMRYLKQILVEVDNYIHQYMYAQSVDRSWRLLYQLPNTSILSAFSSVHLLMLPIFTSV